MCRMNIYYDCFLKLYCAKESSVDLDNVQILIQYPVVGSESLYSNNPLGQEVFW